MPAGAAGAEDEEGGCVQGVSRVWTEQLLCPVVVSNLLHCNRVVPWRTFDVHLLPVRRPFDEPRWHTSAAHAAAAPLLAAPELSYQLL